MRLDRRRGVLNGVARLLVGTRGLEDMRRQYVPNAVGTVRQKPRDRATPRVGIVDATAWMISAPGFVKGHLVICSVG